MTAMASPAEGDETKRTVALAAGGLVWRVARAPYAGRAPTRIGDPGMRSMRPTHLASLVGFVLAVVLSTAGTALAGEPPPPPPPSSTGKVGTFRIVESQEIPAATCLYGDPDNPPRKNSLARMSMVAPRVKAASGRTSQKVTWRLVVQSWDAALDRWTAYAHSSWTAGTAKPRVAATLASRSVRLRTYDDPEAGTFGWRGKAQIRWYARNGTRIVGRATIHPTWYLVREGTFPTYTWPTPLCGWTTG